MKLRLITATALLVVSTSIAFAAVTADDIVKSFTDDGYTRIEVKVSGTQAKVEAIKGDLKVEAIYDLSTGERLKVETEQLDADQTTAPGVFIRTEDRESFVRDGRGEDDDSAEDGDHHGGDLSDDDHEDHGGPGSDDSDESGDDDSGDDHGGESGHGGHGGDDH